MTLNAPSPPAGPALAPDFSHVQDWIFDLDNTLYQAGNGLFAQIDRRMTQFVAQFLSLDLENARRVQKELYREHGTTLAGLINVYRIDPEPYLAFVHDLDLSPLRPDPALASALKRLPGRRFVFTNGCRNHAARILERLELSSLFDEIWDIRTIRFSPKPGEAAYRAVVEEAGLDPSQAAMFDDIARNLVIPKEMGMTTIWLNCQSDWSRQGPDFPIASREHIDHEIGDLRLFLEHIGIGS